MVIRLFHACSFQKNKGASIAFIWLDSSTTFVDAPSVFKRTRLRLSDFTVV